jgi:DNA-binding CsgD family transcriptional regulator/tetratricopeptide (TPR) repeat protein
MPPLGELAASLHGRALEQDRLLGLLNDARSGRSGAAVLVGEPGAGKSALLELVRAAAEGMAVLEARGVESEATLPFAALHQLLRPVFELLERLPAPQASALRAAFALKGGGAPDLYRVPLAVLTLLAEAAEDQPLVCVIDDAQWVDGDSAQALTFAARRLQAERIAIVFAARKGEFDAAALPELRLEPLDTTAVEAILTARAGTAVAPDVARRIASATGGNALAVVELAPLLTREQLAGGEPLPQPVPMSAGVERLFADRVRGLPAEARLPLLVAAADDTGKPDAVAAAARRLGTDLAALDSAEEDGLIRVGAAEITFRHPLVRSAIYGTATFAERRAVHRALAQTFKDAGEIDRYAWHLAAATLEPEEEVARELEQAAARARSRNAFTAASAAAERAAELSPSPHEKGRRLAEAASDAWLTGLLPQAARLIEAAEPLVDDPVLLANCHRLRGSIELAAGTSTTAINMLVTGARRLRGVDPRRSLELLALAAEGASLSLDADASRAIADLASSLDVGEDEHDRFFIGLLVGFAQHLAGDTQSGIAAIREALAIAEDEFDDVDLMLAAGRAGFYVGDDAAALRFHTRIVSRARSIGSIGCLAIAGTRLALAETLTGRWSEAHATAEETLRLAEDTGQRELEAHAVVWLALIAAWQGDEERSRAHLDRARSITATRPLSLVDDASRWVLATIELGVGRAAAAALAQLEPISHPVVARLASLDRVEAAVGAGRPDLAQAWLEDFSTFTQAADAAWARARLAHCRAAIAADPGEREGLYEEALCEHAESSRPFERARTELAYGEFLRRHRRRVDAREHLRPALETFVALEAKQWAERARAELRASGENARPRRTDTETRLTPQEFQIARFVSRGMSNREVAAQLFLSPRTVDFHLRNVFPKLGIASRTELATLQLEHHAPTRLASGSKAPSRSAR